MRRKKILLLFLSLLILIFVCGCEEETKQIKTNEMDVGEIMFTPSNPKIFEKISFNISDLKNYDLNDLNFNWSFGDGSKNEYNRSVIHEYSEPGFYNVTLVVSDGSINAEKTIRVFVNNLISSCDIDFNQPGGWNIKARNYNTSSFEFRLRVADISDFHIIIYNSSNDVFYHNFESSDIWFKYEKGSNNYSLIKNTYSIDVQEACDKLKGHFIGENFTYYSGESEITININDLNCVFSNDLFSTPSDAEVKNVK